MSKVDKSYALFANVFYICGLAIFIYRPIYVLVPLVHGKGKLDSI